MGKLYALLVGIDAYQPPLRPLTGCLNDLSAMEEFLTKRVPPGQLSLRILRDKEATRLGIIETFRNHLGQAGSDDTALFYYSGHGSREPTPDHYLDLEPDGYDETLVAYDSRLPGEWDLAGKELSVMVAEVAQRGPHIVIILDSSHSGGATRQGENVPIRRAQSIVSKRRPADTFWFFSKGLNPPTELDSAGNWKILPSGRHVLLAACQSFQSAREYESPEGKRRGAFSYFLIQAMEQLGGNVRYLDLHKRVQALVAHSMNDQTPQAEGDLESLVFGGILPASPPVFHIRKWRDHAWRLDAGQAHAIQPGAELAVMREGFENDVKERLATIVVSQVEATESVVELKEGTLPDDAYVLPAIISKLPFPRLIATLKGTSLPRELIKRITASPYLRLQNASESGVIVEAVPEGLRLQREGSPRNLAPVYPADPGGVMRMVVALEKIARWEAIVGLVNPNDPLAGALRMTIFEWKGAPSRPGANPQVVALLEKGEVRLPYEGERPGRFTVRIENLSERDLYFTLLGVNSPPNFPLSVR